MSMDVDYLTKLVIEKFLNSNGYSEVPIVKLKESIHKHLDGMYTRKVHLAHVKLEIKKSKGETVSEVEYSEAVADVQNEVIRHAYAIAAINNKDIQDLRDMAKL